MRRRTLLGGIGSMVMLAPLAGCRPWLKRDPTAERASPHQRATVAAMAATFLPSGDGSPGADEADAASLILDPAFAVVGYLSELVSDLDDWCFVRHGGRAFVALSPPERETALEERMGLRGRFIRSWYLPVYEGVLTLTKLAFFGGLRRTVGATYVGFPGPSTGYAADSAAGVHAATGTHLAVEGHGQVTSAWVTALVAGVDPAHAALYLITPGGTRLPVPATAGLTAPLAADHVLVAAAASAPARGTWQLVAGPDAVITAWWLTLRTDLDDHAGAG